MNAKRRDISRDATMTQDFQDAPKSPRFGAGRGGVAAAYSLNPLVWQSTKDIPERPNTCRSGAYAQSGQERSVGDR